MIVVHSSAVPFTVFKAYHNSKDFKILDNEIAISWEDLANSNWPSYSVNPVTLQVEPKSTYYSGEFVAGELINPKTNSLDGATFRLDETSPKLVDLFAKKGLLIVPSLFTCGYWSR